MTPFEDTFGMAAMKGELIRDEGLVLHPYKDPGSGYAIGVGRNLTTQGISAEEHRELGLPSEPEINEKGITEAQAMGLLDNDIKDRVHQLDAYIPWWRLLTPARQRTLINMAFRMGTRGMLEKSSPFINAIMRGHYGDAAQALEAADWYAKLHVRGARLAAQVRQG